MIKDRNSSSASDEESRKQNPPSSERSSEEKKKKERKGRQLAEWVSLCISVVLILGIAGFLLYEALNSGEPYLVAETEILYDRMKKMDGTYILPIEIRNDGEHAIRELTIQVSYTPPGGKEETRDLTLNYLGEGSSQKRYLYFKDDPKTLDLKAEPQDYNLD